MVDAGSPEEESRTSRLVRAARAGDRSRFADLYSRIAPSVFAWAALRVPKSLRSRLDPEDIVQETWVRAFERFDAFDQALGSFRAWTFGIAGHVLLKALRALRDAPASARAIDPLDVPDEATSISRRVGRDEMVRGVIGLLERLEADERRIVIERGLEERPFAEIAALHGIEEAAARKRWQRARERLAGLVPDGFLADGG
jgi:RNA polymerase sigma-70 factor (ECF subfamily)